MARRGVACVASVDAGVLAEEGRKRARRRDAAPPRAAPFTLAHNLCLCLCPPCFSTLTHPRLPLSRRGASPTLFVALASFLRLGLRGATPLERRQRPGGACAPQRGGGSPDSGASMGEGKGAPPCSVPRSFNVHPTIANRAPPSPPPPLATAPLPGPPRSPHSVLGITAYSTEPDTPRQGARQRPPASLCSTDHLSARARLSLLTFSPALSARSPLVTPLPREENSSPG